MTTNRYDHHKALDETALQGRPVTDEEVAYRNGYVRGRSAERYDAARERTLANKRRRALAREENTFATALLLILFIITLGAIGGAFFYYNSIPQGQEAENPDINIQIPESPEPVENNTIIERTIERTQETIPSRPAIELPNVEINVPGPTPSESSAAESAPPQTDANLENTAESVTPESP